MTVILRKRIGLTVAAILALGAGSARGLVGPSAADTKGASWTIMILWSRPGLAGFCSAAVIASDVVATAAHCVDRGADLRAFYRDATGGPALLPIARTALHPLYRADAAKRRIRSVDLALLRLGRPLPQRFRPLALDPSTASIGEKFRIFGYGLAHENDRRSGGALRTGVLEAEAPISRILLWARDPTGRGLGACAGDSGAPILRLDAPVLTAVADWATGREGRSCGDLTQAALIAPQRGWIAATLRDWGRPASGEPTASP